ncbi:sarcosine oxidase subunit gamma [Aestuariivirga sp.]|jgi:sarcosine oxidase subunit gamma|uniref:sarcosine oxidase subunit gamma n=1 Tax=Aestuariivirga sp. TaxID=2650926 RepID=UPI0037840E87
MSELSYETPLAGVIAPPGLAISLREVTDRGMIDLRGLASDSAFIAAVSAVLGAQLPLKPRSSVTSGDVTLLWLSIDQWLVLCPRSRTEEMLGRLRAALQGIHSLAVDVSDMRTVIRLEGEGCREILMKGTSLDLLDGNSPPGFCKRMRYAEIAALLNVVDENVFDVFVFRSYARYTWDFLCATAREPARLRLFGSQSAPV